MLLTRSAPSDAPLADEVTEAVIASLEARGIPVELPPAPRAAETPSDLRGSFERASTAYTQLALDDASRAIVALLETLERTGGAGLEPSDLARAHILAAAIARALLDETGARAHVTAALVLAPDLVLDPALEPPPLLAMLEASRAALAFCDVALEVAPSDATIVLDGVVRTSREQRLPCGSHFVRVEAPGWVSVQRTLLLAPGDAPSVVSFALEIDAPVALASPGAPFGEIGLALHRAAEALEASLLVLDVARSPSGDARARLTGLGDPTSARVSAGPTEADALARALLHGNPVSSEAAVDPWPFVALGVGLGVAVAAAIALGVALSPGSPSSFSVRGGIAP